MYLVTGGAGFIGSHLVKELSSFEEVSIIDVVEPKKKVKFIKHDIRKEFKDFERLGEIKVIFHLAAKKDVAKSMKEPKETIEVNVKGTLNVLELARKKDAKVIIASSSAVYGEQKPPLKEGSPPTPISVYGLTKAINEEQGRAFYENYGLDVICLRYFNVYGGGDGVIERFLKKAMKGEELRIFGDGKQSRDFIYVKDVVKATIRASKLRGFEIINVGRGEGIKVMEVTSIIEKLVGKVKISFEKEREGDIKESYADVEKAKKLLNWEAKTEIREGIKLTYEHMKKLING